MAAPFKANLFGPERIESLGRVIVRFELMNSSDTHFWVLSWFTPLEGIDSDCLTVRRNGKTKIVYDGPLIKRGAPGTGDYLLVRAGETIQTEFDLSESYSLSRPGTYSVSLNIRNIEYFPATGKRPRLTPRKLSQIKSLRQSIIASSTTIVISKTARIRRTRGELARAESTRRLPSQLLETFVAKRPRPDGARPAKFLGGTAAQRRQVQRAHDDGFQLCQDSLERLTNDDGYRDWFGHHTSFRFSKVLKSYARIISRMRSRDCIYDLRGNTCRRGAYGMTYRNSSVIWLCEGFWQASATGQNSRAGTIVHEHSHCAARTLDFTYGFEQARALAAESPEKAIRNADNFEYFAEHESPSDSGEFV